MTSCFLFRFFAFFQNVDPGNASKSDGADKHRGGAGGDGGARSAAHGSLPSVAEQRVRDA